MSEEQIFKQIKELADQQSAKGEPITRTELAYVLKKWGIEKDSIQVSELVWKAYIFYKKDSNIRDAFIDNGKRESLTDQFQIYPLIEAQNEKVLTNYLARELSEGDKALRQLQQVLNQFIQTDPAGKTRFMNVIIGTQGVANVQDEASRLFDGYSNMVGTYEKAKEEVKDVITDFVAIREYIQDIYRQYSLALIDVFGDSIKAISPELFDFNTVQWLDVQGMMQNIQLAYNQISGRCGELMGEISESFTKSLQKASDSYQRSQSRSAGLMLAGINMLAHYMDAQAQTAVLKQQLGTMKNDIKHDATLIKGDMGRLCLLYKTMNELHIPRAEAFYKYSRQILSGDLKALLNSIYSRPEIQKLKQHRDTLLAEYKEAERIVADCQFNIDYYTSHIADCQTLINSMSAQYHSAKADKPSKPSLLGNLFSMGASEKRYNRAIAEWYRTCQPVITQYEELRTDVEIEKKDMEDQRATLNEYSQRMKELNAELKKSSKEMLRRIQVAPEVKQQIAKQLESIVKLLRVAKDIAGSRLDKKLVSAVSITDFRQEQLSAEVTQNIRTFADALRTNVQASTNFAKESIQFMESEPRPDDSYSEEELQAVAEAQNETIQSVVNLFENWSTLKASQQQSRSISAKYNKELDRLRSEFREALSDIDNKSAVVREAIRRVHTGTNDEEVKSALLALSDIDNESFTPQDWEDFFNGNKTLNI